MRLPSVLLPIAISLVGCSAIADAPQPNTPHEAPVTLQSLSLTQLDGTPLPPETLAGKAVLFVNVASRCGYTRQYDGLQALYADKVDDGLVVVGIPCNQFGGQEPGSAEEIATFCRVNYGVNFPILAKQDVNGADRSALYASLIGSSAGGGADVAWNFEKFLVAPDGTVSARFPSSVEPNSPELIAAINALL